MNVLLIAVRAKDGGGRRRRESWEGGQRVGLLQLKVGLPGRRLEARNDGGEDGGSICTACKETGDHIHDDR